jgi:hypothetical protein
MPFNPNAVNFHDASGRPRRNVTYAVPSKVGMISYWARREAANKHPQLSIGSGVILETDNDGYVACYTPSFDMQFSSLNPVCPFAADWYHILVGWDRGNSVAYMYVNDVDVRDPGSDSFTDSTIDYPFSTWDFGFITSSGIFDNGSMAEIWFAPGQLLDLSNVTNRRKFIDGSGAPVDLGSDGSTPTGSAPAMYMSLRTSDPNDFLANRGSVGGTWDLSFSGGALSLATDPPGGGAPPVTPGSFWTNFVGTEEVG